jgi:hypothetical protein
MGFGRGRGVAPAHADLAMRARGMIGVGKGGGHRAINKMFVRFIVTDALSEALYLYILPLCTPVAEKIMFRPPRSFSLLRRNLHCLLLGASSVAFFGDPFTIFCGVEANSEATPLPLRLDVSLVLVFE